MSQNDSVSLVEPPRIAIFQAFWRLHSNAVYAALLLADAGYLVDIFLYKVDMSLPTKILTRSPRIVVHSFKPEMLRVERSSSKQRKSAPYGGAWVQRAISRLFFRGRSAYKKLIGLCQLYLQSDAGLIPRDVLWRTAEIIRERRYRALIGVEKGGLVWAGIVASRQPSALIYLNLELFTAALYSTWGLWYKRMKIAEEKTHRRCWATIVQDPARGRVLLEDNNIERDMKMLYMPISRLGSSRSMKSHWLQTSLQLPESQIVILSHGMISEDRYTTELARIAQTFDDDWVLVFHGWGWNLDNVMHSASSIDEKKKIRFSLKMVDLFEEANVVGSAHISLVLYKGNDVNDRMTGFASEKLALSLQCGVPVIAFDFPSYEHIRNEGCGVLITDLAEIPGAIRQILSNHAKFRNRAFSTFARHYSFETNFKQVLIALQDLPSD